jgi:hypothetical protein
MTDTIPDVDTIDRLDFKPACQSPVCTDGHPTATHIGSATCGCHAPICTSCAEKLIKKLDLPCFGYSCSLCRYVTRQLGRFGDFVRIDPLP